MASHLMTFDASQTFYGLRRLIRWLKRTKGPSRLVRDVETSSSRTTCPTASKLEPIAKLLGPSPYTLVAGNPPMIVLDGLPLDTEYRQPRHVQQAPSCNASTTIAPTPDRRISFAASSITIIEDEPCDQGHDLSLPREDHVPSPSQPATNAEEDVLTLHDADIRFDLTEGAPLLGLDQITPANEGQPRRADVLGKRLRIKIRQQAGGVIRLLCWPETAVKGTTPQPHTVLGLSGF